MARKKYTKRTQELVREELNAMYGLSAITGHTSGFKAAAFFSVVPRTNNNVLTAAVRAGILNPLGGSKFKRTYVWADPKVLVTDALVTVLTDAYHTMMQGYAKPKAKVVKKPSVEPAQRNAAVVGDVSVRLNSLEAKLDELLAEIRKITADPDFAVSDQVGSLAIQGTLT